MTMVDTRHYLEIEAEPGMKPAKDAPAQAVEVLTQWKAAPMSEQRWGNCPNCGWLFRLDGDPRWIPLGVCECSQGDCRPWGGPAGPFHVPGEPLTMLRRVGARGGPRNVLIRRPDGSQVVRPARGLTPTSSPRDRATGNAIAAGGGRPEISRGGERRAAVGGDRTPTTPETP